MFVTGVSVWVTVETTGVTVLVTGVSVLVTVETTGVTVFVTGASVWVTVETTGAVVAVALVTDPSALPACDVALVTVLLTCASPPTVCLTAGVLVLTTGVLVLTTGESVWAPCLMTGATVFVTGAALARLPVPPMRWTSARWQSFRFPRRTGCPRPRSRSETRRPAGPRSQPKSRK